MVNYDFLSVYFYSVPNLRFEKFNNNWSRTTISKVCVCNPKNEDKLDDEFIYIDLESVEKGVLKSKNIIHLKNAPSRAQRILYKNDILFQSVRPYQRNNYLLNEDDDFLQYVASTGYIQLRTTLNPYFLFQLLNTDKINNEVMLRCTGTSYPAINSNDFSNILITITNDRNEQNKIAKFFSLIEERIQTQIKIIDTLSSQKKQIRNLIFKDIHKNVNCCIQDYVVYEQPQKYIVHSTDYLSYGKDYIPVLTANQSFILGYTLEKDGIYEKGDCIIFDDFTNENKYVDFPFKVKSSALKILQTKEGLMLKFFYEYLQFLKFESTDHKRHYLSEVAVTDINVPNLKEQTFVCKVFNSFDSKLKNEEALLEKYRLQKQFLLNNLFI